MTDQGGGPITKAGVSKRHLWLGVAAGCGCLSLVGAAVVVVIVVVLLASSPSRPPVAGDSPTRPTGGGDVPVPPPEPGSPGSVCTRGERPGLQVQLVTAKMEGGRPAREAATFVPGDVLGAVVKWNQVSTAFEVVWVVYKISEEFPVVTEPKKIRVGPDSQGRSSVFTMNLRDAPVAFYLFSLAEAGKPLAACEFFVGPPPAAR